MPSEPLSPAAQVRRGVFELHQRFRSFRYNIALRICVVYALVSSVWILLSDKLVFAFIARPDDMVIISMIKGVVFVLATTAIIFFLIRRGLHAVRESEQNYRLLFDHSPVGIIEFDMDLVITNCNNRFMEIIRRPAEQYVGFNLSGLQEHSILPSLQMALRGEEGVYEGPFNEPAGQERTWISMRTAPLFDAGKRVKGAVAIVEDISERKWAEQALRDAEKQFRQMFEHSGEGIYQSTPEGKFIAVNPALARMLGYASPQELLTNVTRIEHQLYANREERVSFKRKLEGRGVVKGYVSQLRRKDGTTIWASENARVVKNGSPDASYYEGTLQDITERKRAEEALLESEQRYRSLVEMSPDAIVVHSDGLIVFANAAAAQLLAASDAQDLVGKPILNFVHPEYQHTVTQRVLSVGEEGRNAPLMEEKFIRLDGTVVDVEVVAIPFTYKAKAAVQVIVRDISERNQAEREIKLLAQTVASTKDCVSITDLEDKILFVNDAFVETYGYSREECVGQDIALLRSPLATKHLGRQILPATLAGGWYGEILNRRKDGTDFPVELWTSIVRNDADEPVAMVGVARDITARKKSEESMRKLLRAIEQSDEVIFMTERDGTITYVNPAFGKVYGFVEKEVIGCTPRVLKSGMISRGDYAAFWKKLLAGEGVHLELVNKTKSGQLLTVDTSVNPVFDGDGAIIGFIAIQNDVTERKRAQEERKVLESQLLQAQKIESVGTLAGGIAHDFNNILGIILGHATLLDRVPDDPSKFLKSRDSIITAVQRGASLVQQILTFARKTEVSFQPVNVNETVAELVKMLEETFPKTISFSLRLAPGVPLINADRTRLHQTLLNLCVNARDAMQEGGQLSIVTGRITGSEMRKMFPDVREKEFLCVTVEDTGTGMDETTRRRLFEPFFTTKPTGKGTGLGLAVVHGIMESHQGHIRVDSELGRGTSFRLYFPVPDLGPDARKAAEKKESETIGGKETILFIEDEAELRDLVRTLLESKGYRILTASDGEEALQVYESHRRDIALVISDMGLPKMGGDEVFRRMKIIEPDVKMILASGYLEPDRKADLIKTGALGFVQKPYLPADFLGIIRQTLAGT